MLDKIDLYLDDMNKFISMMVNNKQKKMYFAINVDCYNIALKNVEYRDILKNKYAVVYIDGMGLIKAQKFLKMKVAKERIATTDLFPALFSYLEENEIFDKKFFLFGGKENTALTVRENFKIKFPNVKIAGVMDGYNVDLNNSKMLIEEINKLNIDFLFVGLGCPLQEKWVIENYEALNVNNIITCGGLFDYYSGNVKRAPKWMQDNSLEWFYRLIQEPKRLFKRYVFGNSRFLFKVFKLKLLGRNL